jgi:hypothetical protein
VPLAGALEKLYLESLSDRRTAGLLDSVVTQCATEAQQLEFQLYIKSAKKQIKSSIASVNGTRRSSITDSDYSPHSLSKSFPKKPRTGRAIATRSSVSEATQPNPSTKHSRSHQGVAKSKVDSMETNGIGGATEKVATSEHAGVSMTRSKSDSSTTSSLSSLSSLDQRLGAPSMEGNHASTAEILVRDQPTDPSDSQLASGPKHHHSTTNTSADTSVVFSLKRSSSTAGIQQDDVDDSVESKRRKLEEDLVTRQKEASSKSIPGSEIRGSLRSRDVEAGQTSGSKSTPSLPPRTGQRLLLRSGPPSNKRIRDEFDDLASPTASFPGDFGVGSDSISRSATPNHTGLGRPSKKAKKAARIKMSYVMILSFSIPRS